MAHQPVMVDQVLLYLANIRGGIVIDGTLGQGGHAEAILAETAGDVMVVGLDRDAAAVDASTSRLQSYGTRFTGIHAGYHEIHIWRHLIPDGVVLGMLLDLGLSSVQLDTAGRGFSYLDREALDMRFDPTAPVPSAKDLVNSLSETELADTIFTLGEEKASRKIARAIVRRREKMPFENARDLSEVISGCFSGRGPIHPATRTFQALRIAVNHELEHLEQGLSAAESILDDGGRLLVISYHSLEDRIVKRFLQKSSGKCLCPKGLPVCDCQKKRVFQSVTVKPIIPGTAEIMKNPRSRSAKLRVAERVKEGEKTR